jgi:hypothetical protein
MLFFKKYFFYGLLIFFVTIACNNDKNYLSGINNRDTIFYDTIKGYNNPVIPQSDVLFLIDSLAAVKQPIKHKYLGLKQILNNNDLLDSMENENYLFPDRFEHKQREYIEMFTREGIRIGLYYYEYDDTVRVNNVKQNWLACYGKNCMDVLNEQFNKKYLNNELTALTYIYDCNIIHITLLNDTTNPQTLKWLTSVSNVFKMPRTFTIKTFNFDKHTVL